MQMLQQTKIGNSVTKKKKKTLKTEINFKEKI